jgi:hypothetical protein
VCLRLRDVIERIARMDQVLQPRVDAATAIAMLLDEARGETIPSDVRADQIEALGWLELHLDPAPVLVVTGCNDGHVPEAVSSDLFLPDGLRKALGVMHNERRYARDAYRLQAIAYSRERLTIISGRTTAAGDPLLPSRLLLACDDETMLARIRRMCGDGSAHGRALPIGAPRCGMTSAFSIPELPQSITPPDRMAVTAFRQYLACPYRYALQYLLKLRVTEDAAVELDAMRFGTLAHDVLEAFGRDARMRNGEDPDELREYLIETLWRMVARTYGRSPMPAVRLQAARLEQRLAAFATLQARMRAEGWRIEHAEYEFDESALLDIPEQEPMRITGKIDRIDRHEGTGAWRIIDYKSGEGGKTPFEAHHGRKTLPKSGDIEWQDLQLPLYDHLARQKVIDGDAELGYIVLPKKPDDVKWLRAEWMQEQLDDAIERAREVVRGIRAGVFEINESFHSPFDDFARICQTMTFGGEEDAEGEP